MGVPMPHIPDNPLSDAVNGVAGAVGSGLNAAGGFVGHMTTPGNYAPTEDSPYSRIAPDWMPGSDGWRASHNPPAQQGTPASTSAQDNRDAQNRWNNQVEANSLNGMQVPAATVEPPRSTVPTAAQRAAAAARAQGLNAAASVFGAGANADQINAAAAAQRKQELDAASAAFGTGGNAWSIQAAADKQRVDALNEAARVFGTGADASSIRSVATTTHAPGASDANSADIVTESVAATERIMNPFTQRAAWTGPDGEGGAATRAGMVEWARANGANASQITSDVMPDGRTVYYIPGVARTIGNVTALQNAGEKPKPLSINEVWGNGAGNQGGPDPSSPAVPPASAPASTGGSSGSSSSSSSSSGSSSSTAATTIVDPITQRPMWSGPNGEGGAATRAEMVSWAREHNMDASNITSTPMPDGRIAYYIPGVARTLGNVTALQNAGEKPKPLQISEVIDGGGITTFSGGGGSSASTASAVPANNTKPATNKGESSNSAAVTAYTSKVASNDATQQLENLKTWQSAGGGGVSAADIKAAEVKAWNAAVAANNASASYKSTGGTSSSSDSKSLPTTGYMGSSAPKVSKNGF